MCARCGLECSRAAGHLGSLFLTLVWAVTEYNNAGGWPTGFRTGRMNHDWDPWIIYPLIAGTLAVAVHAWIALGREPMTKPRLNGRSSVSAPAGPRHRAQEHLEPRQVRHNRYED